MNRKASLSAVCLLGLMLSSPRAQADTVLFTPAMYRGGSTDTFICSLLNTKSKAIEDVTIELVRQDGTVIVGLGPFALEPFDDRAIIWISGAEISAYCRAKGKLSKKKTLLSLCTGTAPDAGCQATVSAP